MVDTIGSDLAVINSSTATLAAVEAEVGDLLEAIDTFALHARSENTLRGYAADLRMFRAWCDRRKQPARIPVHPVTVAAYLTDLAQSGKKLKTILRAYAGLAYVHRSRALPWARDPLVSDTIKGIRRDLGVKVLKKSPATKVVLTEVVAQLDDSIHGRRDRALLLLGFAGAFRRSELVALDVGDLTFVPREGYRLNLRRSKTDQEGKGAWKGIPFSETPETCPVRAIQRWLSIAEIQTGALFRSVSRMGKPGGRLGGRTVARVVKAAVTRAGYDASKFSGHSLRSGYVTTAAQAQRPLDKIMQQTGHRSVEMVLEYIQVENVFDAAKGVV